MARLAQAPATPGRIISNSGSLTDLNRLLARLQDNILHANAERELQLRTNEYERSKAKANIDYARTLLTGLEQDALAIKVHSRRQEAQADLNQKREVLEQVTERYLEIEEISLDSDDSSEGEDLLGEIIHTPSESAASTSGGAAQQGEEEEGNSDDGGPREEEYGSETDAHGWNDPPEPRIPAQPHPTTTATSSSQIPSITTTATQPQETGTSTTQALRPRTLAKGDSQPTTTSNPEKGETTALRTQLFSSHPSNPTTATTEALIDHQRAQQDALTESMITMARSLKESTHRFASALREDADVLVDAGRGLEKGENGLGAVATRLANLTRVGEGKGWWGRVLLYVWIAGLALFALVLVFVLPKLRF
ncbi:uncharacterized protein GGS25DRAFT_477905 [Hypoxylon fragiforme]|uniref:uncharacterized protein n=1 Tax=Hypoxylon fragiforme TaxID=63214 RepID=UPI0020C732BB|nr:uncharacterized protein GGS25DRAFT_477905 [Hypoxylon fragiforme]KAI2612952.1 hypothetical protein GGS25DRAFT_477905 [Hypoxylon fragiforme]